MIWDLSFLEEINTHLKPNIMNKSSLIDHLEWGFRVDLNPEEYEDLRKKVLDIEKEYKNDSDFADGVIKRLPELQILHQEYVRKRLNHIKSSLGFIKFVVILYLIGSVIMLLRWFDVLNT